MGEGGIIDLINGTPYPWTLNSQSSYQMKAWTFPATVESGASVPVYVEWNQDPGKDQGDDGGEAVYSMDGTSATFQVQARNTDGFNLEVYLTAVETQNNAAGSTISLGWNHNHAVNFVVGGEQGAFTSNNPSVDWMHQNLGTLGDRKLRQICMPGSHDAGMSEFNSHTGLVRDTNTLTQKFNIAEQLAAGSRWFDLRPVISSGKFYAGHYSDTGIVGWQGANGQSLSDIINNINSFTAQYDELIILDISHTMDTDNDYVDLTQSQWNQLFDQLSSLNYRFNTTGVSTSEDVSQRTLNQFIRDSPCVLVVAELPSGITLGDYFAKGIVANSPNFPFYNVYSNTDDLNAMSSDQLSKLSDNRKKPDDEFFLLSWTLTESVIDTIWGSIPIPGDMNSILELAGTAYQPLFETFGNFTSSSYPNVLYMDLFGTFDQDAASPSTEVAALALAINGIAGRT
ncbi:PLC-like phosphodiesterase [Macrophomina phaseolina]|uniref:PLC-like phosphodiesterase n=1 Tax=Macrophomina phaseolina TaxID=35725 RepID=A0ABQ8GPP7_9PEZI|nr:PLC-like phosphodiesterase [Macrophomina phaseolina]